MMLLGSKVFFFHILISFITKQIIKYLKNARNMDGSWIVITVCFVVGMMYCADNISDYRRYGVSNVWSYFLFSGCCSLFQML
jgi:hypothetical protein